MSDDTIRMICDRLDRIEKKIDGISLNGCSKASQHADQEIRLRSLELDRAKALGAIATISLIIGMVGGWIGKKLGF